MISKYFGICSPESQLWVAYSEKKLPKTYGFEEMTLLIILEGELLKYQHKMIFDKIKDASLIGSII